MSEFALPPVYFIRHGQTDWNRARRVQGQSETDLNATGQAQARAIAAALVRLIPDPQQFRFHASPMKRARQTLAPILAAYGLSEQIVRFDDRLREVSFGEMEGRTWPELNALGIEPAVDPEGYYHWRPRGGESYHDVTARVRAWAGELDGPAIIVAHGGISRILRALAFGLAPRELVQLGVPQHRFFRIRDGALDWFDAELQGT